MIDKLKLVQIAVWPGLSKQFFDMWQAAQRKKLVRRLVNP